MDQDLNDLIQDSMAYDGTCSSGCNPAPKQASFSSVIDGPVYESNYEEQETIVSLTPSTNVACNDAIAAIQKMEDADRIDAAAPASPSRTDAKPSPVRPGLVRTLSWTRRERARRASSPVVVADTQAEAAGALARARASREAANAEVRSESPQGTSAPAQPASPNHLATLTYVLVFGPLTFPHHHNRATMRSQEGKYSHLIRCFLSRR